MSDAAEEVTITLNYLEAMATLAALCAVADSAPSGHGGILLEASRKVGDAARAGREARDA